MSVRNGIIYGDFNFCLPAHMNYGRVILKRILKYGNQLAMVDGVTDEQISFAEMAQKITNVAFSLVGLGVKKGDVVAICSENRIEFMTTLIAVIYSGAVVTFLNSASKDDIIYTANISKPKYVFLSPTTYDVHYKTLKDLNTIKEYIIFGKNKGNGDVIRYEELAGKFVDMKHYQGANFYGRTHTLLIMYSSGTTGPPKGIRLTHLNYITTTYQVPITSRPLVLLAVVPFSNIMGLVTTCGALTHGQTVVFLSRFVDDTYLRNIERYEVGYCVVTPLTIASLYESTLFEKYDLRSVEVMMSGGSPLQKNMMDAVVSRFPNLSHVLQGYGMTEICGGISWENESAYKCGSVGKVLAGIIAKIVDIETRRTLGPGQRGELCVKGSALFEEYIGTNMDEFIEDGYFKTGDIAYYDEEGYFFVQDRLKDVIKYDGDHVIPSELEAVLLNHPGIRDAAIVGTRHKGSSELPTAFVVKSSGSSINEQEIVKFVDSKVSQCKKLRGGVCFVEEIPKSPAGKILRRLLREGLIKPASKP